MANKLRCRSWFSVTCELTRVKFPTCTSMWSTRDLRYLSSVGAGSRGSFRRARSSPLKTSSSEAHWRPTSSFCRNSPRSAPLKTSSSEAPSRPSSSSCRCRRNAPRSSSLKTSRLEVAWRPSSSRIPPREGGEPVAGQGIPTSSVCVIKLGKRFHVVPYSVMHVGAEYPFGICLLREYTVERTISTCMGLEIMIYGWECPITWYALPQKLIYVRHVHLDNSWNFLETGHARAALTFLSFP